MSGLGGSDQTSNTVTRESVSSAHVPLMTLRGQRYDAGSLPGLGRNMTPAIWLFFFFWPKYKWESLRQKSQSEK